MSRFSDVITTDGPEGNVFVILARAVNLLRAHGADETEVVLFRARCLESNSYREVIEKVREYFIVTT